MLEVLIPGIRYGEAYCLASTAYRGYCMYVSGWDTTYGGPALSLPYTTANAKLCYPVNKIYFAEDYSDTSDAVDKLVLGEKCIYYDGGTYITNKVEQEHASSMATAPAGRDVTSTYYKRTLCVDYTVHPGRLRLTGTPSMAIAEAEAYVGPSTNPKLRFKMLEHRQFAINL